MSKVKNYNKLQDAVLRITPDAFRQVIQLENLDPNSCGDYDSSILSFSIREFKLDHARVLLEFYNGTQKLDC